MWLIEDHVFPRQEELRLRAALQELGISYTVVSGSDLRAHPVVPAIDDVVRGSCWWVAQLATQANWAIEKWGTVSDFSFSAYASRFENLLLNDPFDILSFHEFCWHGAEYISKTGAVFVRPDDGFKSFEGQVVRAADFDQWVERTQLLQVRGSMPIIVAPPREICSEWRLLFVDGAVGGGSRYRPSQCPDTPRSVIEFAREAHRIAAPACRCYAMDIAETADGLRVIEIGSVNCVAYYESDPREIVRAISSI